jgi:hypothetical protein
MGEKNMNLIFSESMLDEIRDVAAALKRAGETSGVLPSNPEFTISTKNNGGDKMDTPAGTVFIKVGEILGDTPISEREMIDEGK